MYEDVSTDSVSTSFAVPGSARCLNCRERFSFGIFNQAYPIFRINEDYWVAGSVNNGQINMGNNNIGGESKHKPAGVRPVVTLRADIKVKANKGDTTHVTPETAWNLGF